MEHRGLYCTAGNAEIVMLKGSLQFVTKLKIPGLEIYSPMCQVQTLQVGDLDLIPGTVYSLLGTAVVNPQILPGVALKPMKK